VRGELRAYIAEMRKLFSHRRLAFNFFSWMLHVAPISESHAYIYV
jgi:hypothetical protein